MSAKAEVNLLRFKLPFMRYNRRYGGARQARNDDSMEHKRCVLNEQDYTHSRARAPTHTHIEICNICCFSTTTGVSGTLLPFLTILNVVCGNISNSRCLTAYSEGEFVFVHAVKASGGVGIPLHAFLISAVDEAKMNNIIAPPFRLPGKERPTLCALQRRFEHFGEYKSFWPC
jgi:hypothetical protein